MKKKKKKKKSEQDAGGVSEEARGRKEEGQRKQHARLAFLHSGQHGNLCISSYAATSTKCIHKAIRKFPVRALSYCLRKKSGGKHPKEERKHFPKPAALL